MNPLIPNTSVVALGEVLNSATNMIREITQYKQAIAQLEVQRKQMHEQAKIVHHQIEAQLKQELKRLDHLSQAFAKTLKQNKLMIQQHQEREKDVQKQCMMILEMIAQAPDTETKQMLQAMWMELIKQINLNREESARLQAQLMDANQQFGISVSHRDLSFKDVN